MLSLHVHFMPVSLDLVALLLPQLWCLFNRNLQLQPRRVCIWMSFSKSGGLSSCLPRLPTQTPRTKGEQPVPRGGSSWVYKRPSWDKTNLPNLFLFSCFIKIKPIWIKRLQNGKISKHRNGVKLQWYVMQETLNCVRKCGLICLTKIHCIPTKCQGLGQLLKVAVFGSLAVSRVVLKY